MVVYQIYYKESQKDSLDFIPYFNKDCTKYFENTVIVDLITQGKHKGSGYFGVVGPTYREKIQKFKNVPHEEIRNKSLQEYTIEKFKEKLYKVEPDVMSFGNFPQHDPVITASYYHKRFREYFEKITSSIGYRWKPTMIKDPIYWNYFVAKEEIYEDYVKSWLIPAIEVMEQMPELDQNAGYPKRLPEELRGSFGFNFYPYHPFILERLFSWYCYKMKLLCTHF